MLPIYMDVVEGKPSRTLAEPYRKIAEAAGTDAEGLMKMAAADMGAAYMAVLRDPKALWQILLGTNFGLNFSKLRAARILRDTSPDTYRRAVDAAIDSSWASGPNDGLIGRAYNGIGKALTKAYASLGGRDSLVEGALSSKSAEADDLLRASYIGSSIFKGTEPEEKKEEPEPTKSVISKAKKALRERRKVTVHAADPNAAAFVSRNQAIIRTLLSRLNARGAI